MVHAWIQALGRLNSGSNVYMIPRKQTYPNDLLRSTYSKDARHSSKKTIIRDTTKK